MASWISENLTNEDDSSRAQLRDGTRGAIQDCLFLSVIASLSLALFITDLGLYSDDWMFLGLLSNSTDQSILGLLRAVVPYTRLRPIESLYVAAPYWL